MTLLVSDFFFNQEYVYLKENVNSLSNLSAMHGSGNASVFLLFLWLCYKDFRGILIPDPQSRFVIDSTTAEVSVNAKLIEGQSTVVLKVTYISLFTKIGSHVLMQKGNSQAFPMS